MAEEEMFVFQTKAGTYRKTKYTAKQLKEMEDPIKGKKQKNPEDADIFYIRQHLYLSNENNPPLEKDRVIFVNAKTPYFRSYRLSIAKKNHFSSVCETKEHYACKTAISQLRQLKIYLNGKYYTINITKSACEVYEKIMGYEFETDCFITIDDNNEELKKILGGNTINFEIHHTSRIAPNKADCYKMSGKNIIEFDVPIEYVGRRLGGKTAEQMIDIFKEFYSNGNHYISGTFYAPISNVLSWTGKICYFEDSEGNKLKATVFENKYYKGIYEIRFEKFFENGNSIVTYYSDFLDKEIKSLDDARIYANYLAYLHINQIAPIKFDEKNTNQI
ncbi:MAG: hypothetical protein J6M24_04740 [Lachnospiraceae bacterium]|nr:hypothetical protein [Lachnospiraceae bacterium]